MDLLMGTAKLATDWLASLDERPVGGWATVDELRARPGGPLPHDSADPRLVVEDLARAAEPGLVAIPSGRYFGFVIGGGLPAAVAADWLTTVWDQCPGLYPCGPAAAVAEEVVEEWVRDLLGLPRGTSSALVPGCQTAHLTGLAAARHHVLRAVGWDVEEQGMTGAPPIRAVLGASRRVSVDRALRLPGIGTAAHRIVPADSAGRLDVSRLRAELTSGPTTICAHAGEINTGAVDDLDAITDLAAQTGAVAEIAARVDRPPGGVAHVALHPTMRP